MTKTAALKDLAKRKKRQPKHINNADLYAGSPMYFYCVECGHESDVLPESYTCRPKQLCVKCQELKDKGWI